MTINPTCPICGETIERMNYSSKSDYDHPHIIQGNNETYRVYYDNIPGGALQTEVYCNSKRILILQGIVPLDTKRIEKLLTLL